MQRWEYLTIYIYRREWYDSLGRSGHLTELPFGEATWWHPTALLNELGEQGWELAGVAVQELSFGNRHRLYLKRPRP